jgi:hypothetical protein
VYESKNKNEMTVRLDDNDTILFFFSPFYHKWLLHIAELFYYDYDTILFALTQFSFI